MVKEIKYLSKNDKGFSVDDIKAKDINKNLGKYIVKTNGKIYILTVQKISTYVFILQEKNIEKLERYGFGKEKVNGLIEINTIEELKEAIKNILVKKGFKDEKISKINKTKIVSGELSISSLYKIQGIDLQIYEITENLENDIQTIEDIKIETSLFNKDLKIGNFSYKINPHNNYPYSKYHYQLLSKTALEYGEDASAIFHKLKLITLKSGEQFILSYEGDVISGELGKITQRSLIFNDGTTLVSNSFHYRELIGIKKINDKTFYIITKSFIPKKNYVSGLATWDYDNIIGYQIIKDTIQIQEQTLNKLKNGNNANLFYTLKMNEVIGEFYN